MFSSITRWIRHDTKHGRFVEHHGNLAVNPHTPAKEWHFGPSSYKAKQEISPALCGRLATRAVSYAGRTLNLKRKYARTSVHALDKFPAAKTCSSTQDVNASREICFCPLV